MVASFYDLDLEIPPPTSNSFTYLLEIHQYFNIPKTNNFQFQTKASKDKKTPSRAVPFPIMPCPCPALPCPDNTSNRMTRHHLPASNLIFNATNQTPDIREKKIIASP